MKITVLLDEQYPYGMACTNRTHLYSKGLAELGNELIILIPRSTERADNIRNHEVSGIYDGVKFRYSFESVKRESNLGRKIQSLISFYKSFVFLIRFKPDIILIVTNTIRYVILGKLSSLLTGAKFVREKTEVPYYDREELSSLNKARIKIEFNMFDGLLVISDALRDFFQKDMVLRPRVVEIPILIDTTQHTDTKNREVKPNLVYTGSLLNHKDGILLIIKAFARVLEDHPELRLILTGDINKSDDKDEILTLINELRLEKFVELPGYISKEKLHHLTSSASALIVAKPRNRQNEYNMATKIGEYLLTGRPVIISCVDPISNYLTHSMNAFITEPDENLIADQVKEILENPVKADKVGLAGKDCVMNLFDYKIHCLRMHEFFKELHN